LDRYFKSLRRGEAPGGICTQRIEEFSELTSLDAWRSELAGGDMRETAQRPVPCELAELVGDIERALRDEALPERKAVIQAVVAEIRVRDRGPIEPVFRVPILRPPFGWCPGAEPDERDECCQARSCR
jgi:hypothetical protein